LRRIRWAPAAAGDREPPSLACQPAVWKLYDLARSLKRFPNRGRIGYNEGTRELIVAPTPYIIVYGVEREVVHFFRVIHASKERRKA